MCLEVTWESRVGLSLPNSLKKGLGFEVHNLPLLTLLDFGENGLGALDRIFHALESFDRFRKARNLYLEVRSLLTLPNTLKEGLGALDLGIPVCALGRFREARNLCLEVEARNLCLEVRNPTLLTLPNSLKKGLGALDRGVPVCGLEAFVLFREIRNLVQNLTQLTIPNSLKKGLGANDRLALPALLEARDLFPGTKLVLIICWVAPSASSIIRGERGREGGGGV